MRFPVVLKVHPRYQAPASFYYEMASNGLFQIRSTPLYRAVTQVKTGVPGLLPSWEELELRIPPLPTDLLEEVLAFFRDAWHLHGGEAMVVIFYDGSEEFRVGVPPQTVSGYHDTAGAFHAIHRLQYGAVARPEGFVRLGTLHSHADLPAYSSTLDCMDEQYEDGLHGVFGDLQREMPSRSAAFVANGVRFRLLADEALELAVAPSRSARPDWMARIRRGGAPDPEASPAPEQGFRASAAVPLLLESGDAARGGDHGV